MNGKTTTEARPEAALKAFEAEVSAAAERHGLAFVCVATVVEDADVHITRFGGNPGREAVASAALLVALAREGVESIELVAATLPGFERVFEPGSIIDDAHRLVRLHAAMQAAEQGKPS